MPCGLDGNKPKLCVTYLQSLKKTLFGSNMNLKESMQVKKLPCHCHWGSLGKMQYHISYLFLLLEKLTSNDKISDTNPYSGV